MYGQAVRKRISEQNANITTVSGKIPTKYAGSASAGGSANSAVKLDNSAGSAIQPVYFSGGKPVACTHTLGKSVPANAVFTDTQPSLISVSTTVNTTLFQNTYTPCWKYGRIGIINSTVSNKTALAASTLYRVTTVAQKPSTGSTGIAIDRITGNGYMVQANTDGEIVIYGGGPGIPTGSSLDILIMVIF